MEDKLSVIVKESGLEGTKAQVLLDNFSTYFQIASEWETKAKTIVVSDASQQADMKMARVGRLFLREKRIAIEKTRKNLKEQALREGKAIDGITNILKALIVPIEEYLEKQEKYVEIKIAEAKAEEDKRKQIELEQIQIAKEKAEAEEQERIRKENEQLKKEAREREAERVKERVRVEEKTRAERETAERVLTEERRRHEQNLAAEREKKINEVKMIKCPFCNRSFVA